ncbi:MAG: hypothetical protein MN733_21815 [Nitrososphaera sp.]|nr:hypothetical protein [Nitrososphaera sp.]
MLLCNLLVKGDDAPSFQFSVPPLLPSQELSESILVWNHLVIVKTDRYLTGLKQNAWIFYEIDRPTLAAHELKLPNMEAIIDLAEDENCSVALCKTKDKVKLLQKDRDSWVAIKPEPDISVDGNYYGGYRLGISDGIIFIVSNNSIYFKIPNSSWKQKAIHDLVKERWEEPWQKAGTPSHVLTTREMLFLAWDKGEFGGALCQIPYSRNGDQITWGNGSILIKEPITGLAKTPDDTLWITSGVTKGKLYSYAQNKLQLLIRDAAQLELVKTDSSKDPLPAPAMNGICVGPDNAPYIVATPAGVFRIEGKKFKWIIRSDLYICYKDSVFGEVGSAPVGLVLDSDGNIFVASRSLGVLAFLRKPTGFEFKQITFASGNQ